MDKGNKKIKLLFLDHTPFVGGAQLSLFHHIERIDKEKFAVSVVCSREAKALGLEEKYGQIGVECRLAEFPKLKGMGSLNIPKIIRAFSGLNKIKRDERPDIAIANTVRSAIYSSLVFGFGKNKLIWLMRDDSFPRLLFSALSLFCDKIVYNSRATARFYRGESNDPTVIYSGRDVEKNAVEDNKAKGYRQKWTGGRDIFVLGYLGRLVANKGPQTLVEAVEKLKGGYGDRIKCIIAGTGSGQKRNNETELKEHVRNNGLSSIVEFVGYINDPENAISAFDALVVPSLEFDSLPSTIIDAMNYGTVVIASRVGGVEEIVKHGETGYLFDAGDAAGLSDLIGRLVKEGCPSEIRDSAKRLVKKEFSARDNSRKLEAEYINLLK